MLKVFYLDVAYVLQWFSSVFHVFFRVFQMHVSNVSSVFRLMLQVLYLDVSKVEHVLHLPSSFLLPRLGVSSSSRRWLGICWPLPLLSMLVTFGAAQASRGLGKRLQVWASGRVVRPDFRTLANPIHKGGKAPSHLFAGRDP